MELEPVAEVPPSECWGLVAGESIGRLGLSIRALPVVLPVQYYIDAGQIAICLGHHEVPPASLDGTVAAFAVDLIDRSSGGGWAVHCTGRLSPVSRSGALVDCGQPAAGQVVLFHPELMTGQRLRLCPFLWL